MNDNALSIIGGVDVGLVNETINKISQFQDLIHRSLKQDQDYGVIPGTGTKPTLLKPGAEKINMLLGVTPEYEFLDRTIDFKNGFFNYELRCTLCKVYETNGQVTKIPVSQGVGSCNNHEKKYRYVNVSKTQLPADLDVSGLPTFKDKWGNTKYQIPNPDPATLANTILKMAKKRAYIDATLQLAALSDIFTQDLEDLRDFVASENEQLTQEQVSAPTRTAPIQAQTQARTVPQEARETRQRTHNPGVTVLKFGKYNGKTIAEVYKMDSNYIEWLSEKAQNEMIKRDAGAYISIVKKLEASVAKDVTPEPEPEQEPEERPVTVEPWSDDDTSLPFDFE